MPDYIRYIVEQQDGYMDGKPCWAKVGGTHWSRVGAEQSATKRRLANPNDKFRVRKVIRRRS